MRPRRARPREDGTTPLSGGQQQRVAIARSLCTRPGVMLLDEATAARDPETVKEVLVTIRELAEEGMTCLLVTHEMGRAREAADHISLHRPRRERGARAARATPRTRSFLGELR